ncbi:MAG: protein phosphatase 2C domain-containing protein [bacterium]|nr:protein phosphatase 2C domain-containing protein [bacterium]
MSWKFAQAVVIGTSHIASGTVCQDSCMLDRVTNANGEEYIMAFASDGAGSAKRSKEGSELATRRICEQIKAAVLENPPDHLFSEKEVIHWVHEIVMEIRHKAYDENIVPREFACTLLGVVTSPRQTICLQLGDGAIVLSKNGAMGMVFRPYSGEYVNATFTLTDVNGLENLKIQFLDYELEQFAVFTDGIQPLALSYATQTPHPPFFEPMLTYMRNPQQFNPVNVNIGLEKLLGSDKVNERTEDDKTLILATRL